MDALFLPAIIEQALPAVIVLIIFSAPLGLIYMLRSFRLREKELDLRRALAERPRDEEIAALEERVSRLERDRAFFERLANHALQLSEASAGPGPRPRVAAPRANELVDAFAIEASPDFGDVLTHAPRRSAHAR